MFVICNIPRLDFIAGIVPEPCASRRCSERLFLKMCHDCIADTFVLSRVTARIIWKVCSLKRLDILCKQSTIKVYPYVCVSCMLRQGAAVGTLSH